MPDYIGDNHLSQGCGRQRGHANAAIITIAVLIGASGMSAANTPLLKQGKFRDGSTCPALSGIFRHVSCFFFSAVISPFGATKIQFRYGLSEFSAPCDCV